MANSHSQKRQKRAGAGSEGNVLKIAVFILILAVILCGLTWLFTPKWNFPLFVENPGLSINEFRDLDDDNVQVFFVGTSHMQYSVDPMRLYEQQGIVTYNIATSAQPVAGTYFFVKEIFESGYQPKVIVWDASSLFFETSGEAAYRYILDRYLPSPNREELGEAMLSDRIQETEDNKNALTKEQVSEQRLGIELPLYNYHSRWDQLDSSDFHTQTDSYFLQGFYCSPYISGSAITDEEIEENAAAILEDTTLNDSGWDDGTEFSDSSEEKASYNITIPEKNLEYLRRIRKLCDDNSCQLLLVKIPVQIEASYYNSSWTHWRHDAVEETAQAEGLTFLDLNYEGPDLDWTTQTQDGGIHLNVRGSEKVTDFLGNYLVQSCGVTPSVCEDYENKEANYDRYHKIAMLETSTTLPDYVNILNGLDGMDLSVYVSVRDDMRSGLSQDDIDALHSMGFQTDFAAMAYSDSFIGSIRRGEVLYECRSTRQQTYEGGGSADRDESESSEGAAENADVVVDSPTVAISSGGFLAGNVSSIVINGTEYSNNSRGLNIVVYDNDSHIVLDSVTFDTWADPNTAWHSQQGNLFKYLDYMLYERADH